MIVLIYRYHLLETTAQRHAPSNLSMSSLTFGLVFQLQLYVTSGHFHLPALIAASAHTTVV